MNPFVPAILLELEALRTLITAWKSRTCANLKEMRIPPQRNRNERAHSRARLRSLLSRGIAIALVFVAFALPAAPQENESASPEETVVNLAAGRVVIAVVKGAILIGTVENPIEPETHPPIPVAIGSLRAGVILGAVDWWSPSEQEQLARLDQELPHLHSRVAERTGTPQLAAGQADAEAMDIEATGQALLERLNNVARDLHNKVSLPADEPIAELIIADILPDYGPEVWQLTYKLKQQLQEKDYWTTQILRPAFLQFYPPEKGQPKTLIEFSYPPEDAPTPLIELLRQKDPRLEKIVASDARMREVADDFLRGESNKAPAADAIQFLRAALDAIAPPNTRETMASIQDQTDFTWILPPPAEQTKPSLKPLRPAGAPTLEKLTQ